MAEDTIRGDPPQTAHPTASESRSAPTFPWMDLLKVLALPLVTLFLGFWFDASLKERQENESNMRLYTEMMARREQADSELRKDMFKSILDTFMSKDSKLDRKRQLRDEMLNLELLAYNFHESLDIGPLFKDVRNRIPPEKRGYNADLRNRLEKVAHEVIERQLTALSDSGVVVSGSALPEKIDNLQAFLAFGLHVVRDSNVNPGEGVQRLCLSITSTDGTLHYRQFKVEVIGYDRIAREVQVRLYVSKLLTHKECEQGDLDLVEKREIDTNFWVDLFDFPLIDNTRLSSGERCAISLSALNSSVVTLTLAYFPGSRASLKDKPYYDEVIKELLGADLKARRKKSFFEFGQADHGMPR